MTIKTYAEFEAVKALNDIWEGMSSQGIYNFDNIAKFALDKVKADESAKDIGSMETLTMEKVEKLWNEFFTLED